jgi:DNA-binding FadR family transcriptional regulator
LQAVIDRDPEAAAQIMKDHLEKASQILSASEQEETPNKEKDT